ncbi:4-hydroxy-tetrahydrodipicolinate reductase [Crocinitomicaceae bacterium]|nr:4-hydroxy-tetrahydrodipicolinate reductase [Crocinitomicaceae bacterium]
MKIAIIGYGKMGKEIEAIALERGHTISNTFSSNSPFNEQSEIDADVAIEFSTPGLATKHINLCLDHKLPVVVGTTGWLEHLTEIESEVSSKQGSLLHASNFSLGVHLFWRMTEQLSHLMKHNKDYKASITETHHTEKKDQPSGTAITTADLLLKNQEVYKKWMLSEKQPLENSILPVTSKRIPNVPGTHEVTYKSDIDQISLIHEAKNRKGFALGAVIAAEWLTDKKGTFTMSDIINFT